MRHEYEHEHEHEHEPPAPLPAHTTNLFFFFVIIVVVVGLPEVADLINAATDPWALALLRCHTAPQINSCLPATAGPRRSLVDDNLGPLIKDAVPSPGRVWSRLRPATRSLHGTCCYRPGVILADL